MDMCPLLLYFTNHKTRSQFLIGLLLGCTLYMLVAFPVYLYLGEHQTQPLCEAELIKRLQAEQTEVPTPISNPTAGPTRRPGPVHPAPFNVTNPLSGYVNVLKDREPLKLHCRVCALVSSSAQLLHHEAGTEIDKADCVIRMNDAPVFGFEKRVGTRTTVRVVSHSSVPSIKKVRYSSKYSGLKVVAWGPDHTMRTDGKGGTHNLLSELAEENSKVIEVYMLTQQRMGYADKVFENETGKPRKTSGTWLSTDWFSMILATEMCDHIKVYGMSNGKNCKNPEDKSVRLHYYGGNAQKECDELKNMEKRKKGSLRLLTERKAFQLWAQYHNIIFNFPTW
ncbi:alpha-N-acetylgalactosaminide alpha-2,6-sialyltransferase 3-like isoform X1 [Branchiostoma floridae x Branchiostoma japonicum]